MRYVSDDGIEFDNEQECREYENEINAIMDCFVLYDVDLNEINVDETNRYEYIHILSDSGKVCSYIYDQTGWGEGFEEAGIYRLNENGVWQNVDNLIDEYTKKVDSLKAIKTGILQQQANRECGYTI